MEKQDNPETLLYDISIPLLLAILQREITLLKTNELLTVSGGNGCACSFSSSDVLVVLIDVLRRDMAVCSKSAFGAWHKDLIVVGEDFLRDCSHVPSVSKFCHQMERVLFITRALVSRFGYASRGGEVKTPPTQRGDYEFVSDDEGDV